MTIETRPTSAEPLAPSPSQAPRTALATSVSPASLGPASVSPSHPIVPSFAPPPAVRISVPEPGRVFVGRERQFAELTRALEEAVAGAGSLFLVSGEAGIGKTRLAEEATRSPGAGGLEVHWGRCRERRQGTTAPHYWPWIQACRAGGTGRVPGGGPDNATAPAAHHEAARLLRTAAAGSAGASAGDSAPETGRDRFWLMDTVVELLQQATAAQPMLLVLDDLQWADDPSLCLLEFLAPELPATPLVVIGIFREPEVLVDPGLRSVFGRLARLGRSLPLRGLHAQEIEEIVARRFERPLAPAAAGHLCALTGGNPWFIDQVVRLHLSDGRFPAEATPDARNERAGELAGRGGPGRLRGGGMLRRPTVPEAIRSAVRRRLEPLPEETRNLLSTAAGVGSEVSLGMLGTMTGLGERRLLELLTQPAVRQIVAPDDLCRGMLRFSPPILAEAIYDDLGPAQRIELRWRLEQTPDGAGEIQVVLSPDPPGRPYPPRGAERFQETIRTEKADRADETDQGDGTGARRHLFSDASVRSSPETPSTGYRSPAVSHTSASRAGPAGDGVFQQEGEYWTIAYAGTTVRLKDAKGFRYLAQLLARPLLEVHVADLPLIVGHLTRDAGPGGGADPVPAGLSVRRLGDAGQLLDARAKEAYRRRFEHLQEGLREAQEFNDDERKALIEEEMDALAHELAASVGLCGRDRKAASAAERARVNVTRTIRAAIDKIAQGNPPLGVHLAVSIRTGTFCSYSPDPAARPTWRL